MTVMLFLVALSLLAGIAPCRGTHGGTAAAGGLNEYQRANKVQASLDEAHTVIAAAAEQPRGNTARATGVVQMLTNAAIDDSVSSGTMETITNVAMEPHRRSLLQRLAEDKLRAAMYEVSSSIAKASGLGTPKAAKAAARTGRDMGLTATSATTYFNIDHVPDMDMGGPSRAQAGRKLAGERPEIDTTWAQQNTAEAIAQEGAGATWWGNINAQAASGSRGNTILTERLGDVITHQRAVDTQNYLPRRMMA